MAGLVKSDRRNATGLFHNHKLLPLTRRCAIYAYACLFSGRLFCKTTKSLPEKGNAHAAPAKITALAFGRQ